MKKYYFLIWKDGIKRKTGACNENFKNSYKKLIELGLIKENSSIEFSEIRKKNNSLGRTKHRDIPTLPTGSA